MCLPATTRECRAVGPDSARPDANSAFIGMHSPMNFEQLHGDVGSTSGGFTAPADRITAARVHLQRTADLGGRRAWIRAARRSRTPRTIVIDRYSALYYRWLTSRSALEIT